MRLAQRYSWLFLAIAVSIWIAIGVGAMALFYPDRANHTPVMLWVALFGLFGAALSISLLVGRRSPRGQMILIVIEFMAVMAMAAVPGRGDPGPLLALIALQAALLFGTGAALWWVLMQSLLIWVARWSFLSDRMSWFFWFVNCAAELIAVGAVHVLRREAETSQALSRSNAELRATQVLLADSAAAAERARISRELHDAWGHDLTALSLQLEYARHVAPGAGAASVTEARDLAKSLLAKVRDVVGTLRSYEGHDIKPVLEALATGAPQLEVHLDIPATLSPQSAETAQTVMRSAQEIITNTLRHAHARNLWLVLREEEGGIRIDGRDDGEGAEWFDLGHGLSGLRERFEQQGGRIAFESANGKGFRVVGWLPTPASQP
jgi:signal transduction histidine kinase